MLVIGGGIAGVSIGYELAGDHRVGLLEMEASLSYHSTGRSAAIFLESYGGRVVRALTTASRGFLEDPPDGFDTPLLTPRAVLWAGRRGRASEVGKLEAEVRPLVPSVRLVSSEEAHDICPILRPGWTELGLLEPGASDIAVHELHQGYTRGLRRRGGEIHVSSPVVAVERATGTWRVTSGHGDVFVAPVVVNAAGAWVDVVARMAGVAPIGIQPCRRTIFMMGAPEHLGDISHLPATVDVDTTFYLKPEGPQFLCSPADEDPSEPCDAQPEQIDIARALERIGEATTLSTRHVRASWAGLRNFVADRVPVAGFDPEMEGFFWFAGHGGYGIQTAPALSRVAAELIRTGDVPTDLAAVGVGAADLHPARLRPAGGRT